MKKVDTVNCAFDNSVDSMLSGFNTLYTTNSNYSLVNGKYIVNSKFLK